MELRPLPHPEWHDYFAGSDGNIYSTRRSSTPHQLKAGKSGKGYLHVLLPRLDGAGFKPQLVHRLVCEAWHGPPPLNTECSHQDDVKRNNVPSNLKWESKSANHARRRLNGIDDSGHRNSRAALTEEQVESVRYLLKEGKMLHREIADLFGVSRLTITKINTGNRYPVKEVIPR